MIYKNLRPIFVVLIMFLVVFLQWNTFLSGMGLILSPVLLFSALLFWDLSLWGGLWLGMVIGFLLDTFGIFPFGTYIAVLMLTPVFIILLKIIFSNVGSLFTKGVASSIIIFILNSLLYPGAYWLGYLQKIDLSWQAGTEVKIITQSLMVSLVTLIVFSLLHFWKLKNETQK